MAGAPSLPPAPPFEPEAYLDAAAAAAGLTVPAECRPGVALNLRRTWEFAALLLDMPALDAVEPAPVFRVLRDRG